MATIVEVVLTVFQVVMEDAMEMGKIIEEVMKVEMLAMEMALKTIMMEMELIKG